MHSAIPSIRITEANSHPAKADGARVVYWMTACRRARFNFGLQRAAEWARHLGRPLVVLEALRCDYRWASDRLHRFILDGMVDNLAAFERTNVLYHPYVETEKGAGRGLLEALATDAAVVVTDDYPTFFLPAMVAIAAQKIDARLEAVDSNGLLPMAATERDFATAYAFRRFLQKTLTDHLRDIPLEDPLAEELPPAAPLPASLTTKWPAADVGFLTDRTGGLDSLPIDHQVAVAPVHGGSRSARATLLEFLDNRLDRYSDERNRPEAKVTSELSPFLHFGHISAHEVFLETTRRQRWSPDDVNPPANGRRSGWWGLSAGVEAFLDQLVTWRELGFNVCHHRQDHDQWESLPEWAITTLSEHARDRREHTYTLEQFTAAETHDPLWNAAQTQLVREGTIHNYLRMLWGKKILEWTTEPREALEFMIELNNRFALDGRDPNSYSGIFWVLGRHDRAWGPERPIFGKVRYMSSANTARKFPVRDYIERYEGSDR